LSPRSAACGYPDYVRPLVGIAKIAGAVALVARRLPTLREWAYAGLTFDLVLAVASHALAGDSIAHVAPAVFALELIVAGICR
jgi:DoxX-like family